MANSIAVPLILKYGYRLDLPLGLEVIYVAVGEIIGCYVLGELLASALLRYKMFRK